VGRLVANGPRERIGPRTGKKEKGRVDLLGWMVGMGEGLVFFSFFFQILFKSLFFFLNQIFYIFFTTLFITIFKGFSQTFQTYFKFKLSFF
jgi:hypothetical protein